MFQVEPKISTQISKFLIDLLGKHGNEISELDRKIRCCYGHHFFTSRGPELPEMLTEGLRRYPEEAQFYYCFSGHYGSLEEYKKGLEIVEQGLAILPEDANLLYDRAAHMRLSDKSPNETRKAYAESEFLERAPKDHRKVPEVYYAIGEAYGGEALKLTWNETPDMRANGKFVITDMIENMKAYYRMGEDAEKIQMECYLPYDSSSKMNINLLMTLPEFENDAKNQDNARLPTAVIESSSEAQSKMYLLSIKRVEVITCHRERLSKTDENEQVEGSNLTSWKPKLTHKLPKKIVDMKQIKLAEMNPTADKIYENRIITLTLIEDPVQGFPSFHLVAEDDEGDVTRLFSYNFPQTEANKASLAFGCRLSVINPYMRIFTDMKNGICVDDPKCLIYLESTNNMCRFCGEENATRNCANCKWAGCCSRECQKADWKQLKRKLICKP